MEMFFGKYPIEITPTIVAAGGGDFKLVRLGGYGDIPDISYWEHDPKDSSGRAQKVFLKDCKEQPSK
jgi:hypothetical protein